MDRRKGRSGASKGNNAAPSSQHDKSLPSTSEHVDTVATFDPSETDAHLDDQYVFIEHGPSRASSPSVLSEWSIDDPANSSTGHEEDGGARTSDTSASEPHEEDATSSNNNGTFSHASSTQDEGLLPRIKLISASSHGQKARRLTRRCQIRLATMYDQVANTPEELFKPHTIPGCIPHTQRYVNIWRSHDMMLVTDGSCTFNGAADGQIESSGREPSAGASFIYRPSSSNEDTRRPTSLLFQMMDQVRHNNQSMSEESREEFSMPDITGKIGLHLETQGPNGDAQKHTSNRAKLRAVIAALDFRPWHEEGWKRVVLVTDLEYIAMGATKWISSWVKRRWRSAPSWTQQGKMRLGKKIANRDLWEELQSCIETLYENGTEVSFWLVPSSVSSPLLREAKAAAREAATLKPNTVVVEHYTKIIGINT